MLLPCDVSQDLGSICLAQYKGGEALDKQWWELILAVNKLSDSITIPISGWLTPGQEAGTPGDDHRLNLVTTSQLSLISDLS